MSFDPKGYLLTPDDGPQLWFMDTRMNVKAGGAQTGGAFTFLEWSAPAGFGPPLHLHERDDEAFYLLEGELSLDCGDKHFTAGPGDFLFLPRGIPHTFLVTKGPARGLQITAPAGFEDFIAGTRSLTSQVSDGPVPADRGRQRRMSPRHRERRSGFAVNHLPDPHATARLGRRRGGMNLSCYACGTTGSDTYSKITKEWR